MKTETIPSKKAITVTREMIDRLGDGNACAELINNKAKEIFQIGNSHYVITSSVGTGTGKGWSSASGHRVVPLELYNGEMAAMTYSERREAVEAGLVERSYTGQAFTCKAVMWICLEEVRFLPEKPRKQLDIFAIDNTRNYPGNKNIDGVYHKIINEIPKFDVFHELFAGSAAIARKLSDLEQPNTSVGPGRLPDAPTGTAVPARYHLNDISPEVQAHLEASFPEAAVTCGCAISWLKGFVPDGKRHVAFLDPPYLHATRHKTDLYANEMSDDDHVQMLSAVLEKKEEMKFVIIHPQCELYDTTLAGWNVTPVRIRYNRKTSIENIYTNFDQEDLQSYKLLGKDSWDRLRIRRKGDRWIAKLMGMPVLERNYILDRIEEMKKQKQP